MAAAEERRELARTQQTLRKSEFNYREFPEDTNSIMKTTDTRLS